MTKPWTVPHSARICKWTLAVVDKQTVEVPHATQVLTVQMQNGEPQLWALCDPELPRYSMTIAIYGTGSRIPESPGRYIATFQTNNGALVWHAFQISP